MRISIIFIFFFYKNSFAQNIVPNNSFENTDAAGFFEEYIVDWYRYQSIDYYSSIIDIYNLPVPCTAAGCQYPLNGNAFIGLYLYLSSTSDYREYLQANLLKSLDTNNMYCVSLNISKSDAMVYASMDWGILFTDTLITPPSSSNFLISTQPQIVVPSFVIDTSNWVLIRQIYKPTTMDKFLTIGNFNDDSATPLLFTNSTCSGCTHSYYYIDDVSVSLIRDPVLQNNTVIYAGESIIIGDTAEDVATYSWYPTVGLSNPNNYQTLASPQTTTTYTLTKITPCDTSQANIKIEVLAKENNLVVFPNPNNGNFQMQYSLIEDADFVIYDELGRKVYKARLISGSNILFAPVINLASAMYVLTLENENGWLYKSKMVVGE